MGGDNQQHLILDYRLSRARRIVENVFGIMSARYRILRRNIERDPIKVTYIVSAICALHNFIMKRSPRIYVPIGTFDSTGDNGGVINGTWRTEILQSPFINLPV